MKISDYNYSIRASCIEPEKEGDLATSKENKKLNEGINKKDQLLYFSGETTSLFKHNL